VIKLLSTNNESAEVIYANQKPIALAPNSEWPLEIYLPKLIRLTGPKEFPALKLALVPVLIIPCENVVYGFSGKHNSLNAAYGIPDESWKIE
jgi:hypothetical protein